MGFEGLTVVEEHRTSSVLNSGTAGIYGSFVRTDPPVSAYPSNSTAYPKGRMFLPCPGARQAQYRGVAVSTITVTDRFLERTTFLGTGSSHPTRYTLPL
jgi:hypothetical protein